MEPTHKGIWAVHDANMVVSPNATYLPPPPLPANQVLPLASSALQPQWLSTAQFHHPFVCRHMRFDPPFLDCLAYTEKNLPIVGSGTEWVLRTDVRLRWIELENALRKSCSHLSNRCDKSIPLNLDHLYLPSYYGFRYSRSQPEFAREQSWNARQAFYPLFAMLTYLILHTTGNNSARRGWQQILTDEARIPPSLVQSLAFSAVAIMDKSQFPRVGVFINPLFSNHNADYLLWMKYHVPIWIYFGNTIQTFTHAFISQYTPTRETRLEALEVTAGRKKQLGPNAPHIYFPAVEKHSGQRPGETIDMFFSRRASSHAERESKETQMQRTSRLQRRDNAKDFPCPGRHGAIVYEWDKREGEWIRVRKLRSEVETLWEDLPTQFCRYNDFDDEWDICPAFDVNNERPFEDHEDDYNPDARTDPSLLPPPQPPTLLGQSEVYTPNSHLMVAAGPSRRRQQDISLSRADLYDLDLVSQLFVRLGYLGGTDAGILPPTFTLLREDKLRVAVGDTVSPMHISLEKDTVPHLPRVNTFISILSHRFPPSSPSLITQAMPPDMWDLRPGHNLYIKHCVSPHLHAFRLGKYWCLHDSRHSDLQSWRVLFEDPSHVVIVIRTFGNAMPSPSAFALTVARHCAKVGIPFLVAVPQSARSAPPDLGKWIQPLPVSVPHRPFGYIPDITDFLVYEQARDAFLQTPRGCAALSMGGIVWRLAKEALSSREVLSGPCELTSTTVAQEPGVAYKAAILSDDELDFICGMYLVRTRMYLTSNSLVFFMLKPFIPYSHTSPVYRGFVVAQTLDLGCRWAQLSRVDTLL